MKISDISKTINSMIPLNLAQDWDNVGLLIGDENVEVKNVFMAIDITRDVLAEAKKAKAELILSYHPIIWDGLKKVTAGGEGSIVYDIIKSGLHVFSIHTAYDVVKGGVNDALASVVGIEDAKTLGDFIPDPQGEMDKVVVFVPQKALKKVTNAMFKAGAGNIGNYSECGFSTEGIGSFRPLEGAMPTIGIEGELETVAEYRFEAIVPSEKTSKVIEAMKIAHPYEMPAFDVIKIKNTLPAMGLGRIGKLAKATPLKDIMANIKKIIGAETAGIIGKENRKIKTAAVCAGSCGKVLNNAIANGVDLYLTGELKHHQALMAQEAGITCVCLSHTVSERFVLSQLAKELKSKMPTLKFKVSKKDADPFKWKKI